jgi:hypothetical protein
MFDQNTTTALTTFITVLGTLGGVILGVVLSNCYVVRQEKTKRNTAAIEETYTLLAKISMKVVDNINQSKAVFENQTDDVNRIETLVSLYFPKLREDLETYRQSLYILHIKVLDALVNSPSETWKIISPEYATYNEKNEILRSKLEKLVR